MRRLAGDHAALHNNPLPPNYLFGPSASNDSDLTSLDILLAGPTSTPYEAGVFKLHLTIPTTYPTEPPKAYFRTKIFHPNVDDNTGAVCVETLKRDWDPNLSLKDVLITINCLLVQPNASSALNADAGMLLEQGEGGWEAFEKRAIMMTRLHAGVPRDLKEAVRAAQRRGEESEELERKDSGLNMEARGTATSRRRRRGTPLPREMMETPVEANRQRDETPPPPRQAARAPATSRPFVLQSTRDDVFGLRLPAPTTGTTRILPDLDSDSEILPADQENDSALSPVMAPIPTFSPRRQGPSVPLGELSISDDDTFEEEYPPSPKKSPQEQARNVSIEYPPSPRKSPQKRFDFGAPLPQPRPEINRAESSRTGAQRPLLFTPVMQQQAGQNPTPVINPSLDSSLLDTNVTFDLGMDTEPDTEVEASFELPKRRSAVAANRRLAATTARTLRRTNKVIQDPFRNISIPVPRLARSRKPSPVPAATPQRPLSPPSSSQQASASARAKKDVLGLQERLQDKVRKSPTQVRDEKLEQKLWRLCGGDIERWNRGDFGGYFELKASRW